MYVGDTRMIHIDNQNKKSNGIVDVSSDQRRCAVCKDVASGYHYGVWSCEGCKAFFKRSIQGPCDYICPATNSCTIDKHRRKSCQACRLRMCYEVGMSKGGTRRERRPYRRKNSLLLSSEEGIRSESNDFSAYSIFSSETIGDDSRSIKPINQNNEHTSCDLISFGRHLVKLTSRNHNPIAFKGNEHTSELIQNLINLEYNPTMLGISSPESQLPSNIANSQCLFIILATLFDKELVFLINWAKCIPYYTHLMIEDQIRLIEAGWLDVLILNYIKHSIPMKGSKIFFAPDFILDRDCFKKIELLDLADSIFSLIRDFCSLDLSIAQFSSMKAVCFMNSINRTFDTNGYVFHQIKSNLNKCFRFACQQQQQQHPCREAQGKLEHLLLILPHIKIISNKILLHLMKLKENKIISPGDLLNEMLDAQESLLLEGHNCSKTHSDEEEKASNVNEEEESRESSVAETNVSNDQASVIEEGDEGDEEEE